MSCPLIQIVFLGNEDTLKRTEINKISTLENVYIGGPSALVDRYKKHMAAVSASGYCQI